VGSAAARLRGVARPLARPALGLSILLVLGTDLFFLSQRNVTTPVTLGQSVARYRQSEASTTTVAPAASGAGAPGTAPPAAQVAGGRSAPTATTVPRRGDSVAGPPPPPSVQAPFVSPAEGVYTYATTGYEQISLGGSRHSYPAESFATVRHGDGCRWDFEHRVVEEHVETAHYCGLPGVLQFLGEVDQETFYGQTQSVTITCDPPETAVQLGDKPGTKRTFICSLSNGSRVDETVTYLGRDAVVVGGTSLQAFHFLVEGRESGSVQGTSRFESWVHPVTALPLRTVVNVQSRSQAFGANVDYQEDASYTLERLTPST
jgi:hypothetical protein